MILQEYCPSCNSITYLEEQGKYNEDTKEISDLYFYNKDIILYKCSKCGNPFLFRFEYSNVEGDEFDNENIQLYPNESKFNSKSIPKNIFRLYYECEKCFKIASYEASVIMARKCIEALCIDKGEKEGKLINRLENLKKKNILDNTFYLWANDLRIIGNLGAHSHDDVVTKQDAEYTLEFLKAILTYLYILMEKYRMMQYAKELNFI